MTTPASFWAMLAGAPDASAARRMCEKLQEGGSLCVPGGVPSLARTDVDFNPQGRYWLGSVWLPTSYMTVKAVERYGRLDLAREIALKTVRHQYETFRSVAPHTIWECYNPLEPMPATRANGSPRVAPDFCGWSALGPISLLLENVIGIRSADAFENRVVWDPPAHPGKRLGVRRYRFGSTVCDLLLENGRVTVTANRAFTLVLDGASHAVGAGTTTFARGE